MTIRNVVFDIGNVLTRWDPHLIVERALGKDRATDSFVRSIFPGDSIWRPLNLGHITAQEAMQRYREQLGLTSDETDQLWFHILDSQDAVPGTLELMKQLKEADYGIYALSDNVHEIVDHLKANHAFWPLFDGAVISAEVCLLKPDPDIYRHLLTHYELVAEATIFMDDILGNVEGAQSTGMKSFQFCNADQAKRKLLEHGVALEQNGTV